MRDLIIIESPTTGAGIRLIEIALGQGCRVILFTIHSSFFKKYFRDRSIDVRHQDIFDQSIVEEVREIVVRSSHFAITTVHDRCLLRCAELANAFGARGLTLEVARMCNSKLRQREKLNQGRVRQADSVEIAAGITEIDALVSGAKYPLVVKPEHGSSSTGVKLCHSVEEVNAHLEALASLNGSDIGTRDLGSSILEQFLVGEEYGVEIFNGQCVGIVKKITVEGHPEFIELGYVADSGLPYEIYSEVVAAAKIATETLEVTWGPAHVDIKMTCDGPYVLEVNPRVAGSIISDLVFDVYGFDLVKELLHLLYEDDICTQVAPAAAIAAGRFIGSWEVPENFDFPSGNIVGKDHVIDYRPLALPARARIGRIYGRFQHACDIWNELENVKTKIVGTFERNATVDLIKLRSHYGPSAVGARH